MPDSQPHDPPSEDETADLIPTAPQAPALDPLGAHYHLYQNVRTALSALPAMFTSELVISGVLATDLFTFNASLGATIEAQVTLALNELRSLWDPEQRYVAYRFVRQPQTFPDVTLRAFSPDAQEPILMGIELKGWYALAKEREPSFRYKVTSHVCASQDLLVVYPWTLSNVISGSPLLFAPYVVSAQYAAEYRNWHWRYKKRGEGDNTVHLSSSTRHYPAKADPISDEPASDKGGNFGRFARTGLMDTYIETLFQETLSGIPLYAWQRFLALFSEDQSADRIRRSLDQLAAEVARTGSARSTDAVRHMTTALAEIAALLDDA